MPAEYITPDDIYVFADWLDASRDDIRQYPEQSIGMPRKPVGGTFVYSETGYLSLGSVSDIHMNLIRKDGMQLFGHQFGLATAGRFREAKAENTALLGRMGLAIPGYGEDRIRELQFKYSLARIWQRIKDQVIFVVSFWNKDPDLYDVLLPGCMDALQPSLPKEVYLSTPLYGTGTADQAMIGTRRAKGTQLDPAAQERLRMQRELHLMRPDAKKAAMSQLGLAQPKGPHPWQQQPGQKWWAMHSESADMRDIADMITEDPDLFN